ncbi:MAG TPA: C25 family cysteine peptidase, partial [Defluviitoga tunisiensis]|nr:C25 family cysteine peptidase [Defluviitoga tunisiensis]
MKKLILLVLILFLLVPLMLMGQKEINSETGGYVKAVPDYDSDCDYIIILPQQTKDEFNSSILTGLQDFINFKEKSGFKVKVATVSEIEACTPGRDRAEQIRNFLREIYFTGEKRLKYAILIGDVGQYWYYRDQSDGDMPLRFIFPDDSRHEWEERSNKDYLIWPRKYTDLYYANLTLDWDRDMDGYFEKEDIDYRIPEINIMVGRIPYSSYLIVNKILHQIIDFERKRGEGGERKILLAEANRLNLKSNPSTFAYLAEDFANKYRNNNFIITTMFEKEGDAVPLIESDLPITQENLNQEMLKGYDIVHLSGYDAEFPIGAPQRIIWIDLNKNGDVDIGEFKNIPLITISDLHSLREMQSVVVVPTCDSAELSEDGFAKLLLILTKSPAVIGYSWFPFSQAKIEKVGKFDFMLFERLIQGLSIGKAFYQSYFDFGSDPDMMDAQPLLLGDPSLIVFPSEPHKIIASSSVGGTISPFGEVLVDCGSSQSFMITPDFCYQVKDVLVDGISVGPVSSYTFTNIQANHKIEAVFEKIQFQIITSSTTGGTISPFGEVLVDCGSSQSFMITPDFCYQVKDVLVDGISVGPVSSYTFTNIQADHKIEAIFEKIQFQIIASSTTGGTISPSGEVLIDCGSSQSFRITPDSNYYIKDVLVDGISVGPVGSYTFTNIQADHKIEAVFEKKIVLELKIGSKIMVVNGVETQIDVPPQIVEGRTLLPIRWVAEPLGANVDWNGVERKVTVTLKDTKIELWIGKNIAKVNGVDTPIDP